MKRTHIHTCLAVCALALTMWLCGCTAGAVALKTPEVSLDGATLSWAAVDNAALYEICEDGEAVDTTDRTSYTIVRTDPGEYAYSVRALPAEGSNYLASDLSVAVTYVVLGALARPELSLSGGAIVWGAVEHADRYEVYLGGDLVSTVTDTRYNIPVNAAGTYVYTVRAVSDGGYPASEVSEPIEYVVKPRVVDYTVTVTLPDGYDSDKIAVTVLSGGEEFKRVEADVRGRSASAAFRADEGEYVAYIAAADLPAPYVATRARLYANVNRATLFVLDPSDYDTIEAGEHTLTATDETAAAPFDYLFTAPEAGWYTLRAATPAAEGAALVIAVDDIDLVDTFTGATVGEFEAEEGEVVLISVVGTDPGEYSYELIVGKIKQYLTVGSGYGDSPNVFTGSCVRYLNLTAPAELYFQIPTPTLQGRTVVVKVNGVSYDFGENSRHAVSLPAGDDIEVEIEVGGSSATGGQIALFVYPVPVQ